jgi:adenylate cyclase class IV
MIYMNEDEACAILLLHRCNNKKINRNRLRNVLKLNKISYHKPGPDNNMKTKLEMELIVNNLALLKLNEILKNFKFRSVFI